MWLVSWSQLFISFKVLKQGDTRSTLMPHHKIENHHHHHHDDDIITIMITTMIISMIIMISISILIPVFIMLCKHKLGEYTKAPSQYVCWFGPSMHRHHHHHHCSHRHHLAQAGIQSAGPRWMVQMFYTNTSPLYSWLHHWHSDLHICDHVRGHGEVVVVGGYITLDFVFFMYFNFLFHKNGTLVGLVWDSTGWVWFGKFVTSGGSSGFKVIRYE